MYSLFVGLIVVMIFIAAAWVVAGKLGVFDWIGYCTGFLVDSVTLEAPKPDANTAKAIQGVVDAQQNLEKAEIEKKQATIHAEKTIEEARGKAEANEIIQKSLTPEIVEMKKIEKWDGKLPQVSGEANPFVQVK